MSEYEITFNQVKEVLEQIAQENPDKIAEKFYVNISYYGCRYLDPEGEPSCVVGIALDRLGVSREEIGAMDQEAMAAGGKCPQSVGMSRAPFWKEFDPEAKEFLGRVQYRQDRQTTWGEAISLTLMEMP